MDFANLLLLISAFQGFVLAFLIIFSPFFKSKANNYLGYTIGILSLILFNFFLDRFGVFDTYPKFFLLTTIEWVFLFSVFFLYYCIHLIKHDLRNNRKLKWLYLPFIVSITIHILIHLENDYSLYSLAFEEKDFIYNLILGLEQISTYLFTTIIFIWARIILHKSPKNTDVNVIWLKKLWFALFIILLSWIIIFIVDIVLYGDSPELDPYIQFYEYVLDIELSLLVYWIAYTGLYKLKIADERKEILHIINKKSIPKVTQHNLEKKQKVSVINDFSEDNVYFLQLKQFIHEEHIYRDSNLSQDTVAEKLGISVGYLSQIINTVTQKNFKAYINGFRVEETKRMMLDTEFDKYSLLSIGLESGFNSKTTFYNSFKKETGYTPSEFKTKHK